MTEFQELETSDLESIEGGTMQTMWASVRHGLFEGYKTVVSYPTAAIGGWKLAGQMYGSHVTMNDRVRAMRDVRGVLAASDTLPAWAHR
jgi:hypothetical protein